jgi:hypothetical protein
MKAIETLGKLAEKTGWNDRSKLDLACEFIDGLLNGQERFAIFLQDTADQEQDNWLDEDWSDWTGLP